MRTKITALGVVGYIIIILAFLVLLLALIWMIYNAAKSKPQAWWLWLLLAISLVLLIVGAVVCYFGYKSVDEVPYSTMQRKTVTTTEMEPRNLYNDDFV